MKRLKEVEIEVKSEEIIEKFNEYAKKIDGNVKITIVKD
jgi:hypothetical protein